MRFNYSKDYILQEKNATILSLEYLYKSKCTWTDLTSGINSFRFAPTDTFYDISGHCFLPSDGDQLWLLAYSNSNIFSFLLNIFNSTFHCQVGDVAKIVVPNLSEEAKRLISKIGLENVEISKFNWNSFETSWDYKRNSLI